MAATHRVQGTGASPGVALGPAHLAGQIEEPFLPPTDTAVEHQNLAEAIQTSIDELERLAGRSGPESAAILDFQIEVLRDPAILEMTTGRIDAGDSAAFAWVNTLDSHIRDLEEADDEQLRARAVDIVDVKNRVLSALAGKPLKDFPAGSIFVGNEIEPSRFLAHDWSRGGGIVLFNGSAASHVAMLARTKSVPMVVATGHFAAASEDSILVDGDAGMIMVEPDDEEIRQAQLLHGHPANIVDLQVSRGEPHTADGAAIRLSINLNDPAEMDGIDPAMIDGVGLMRSEFALSSLVDAANEEKQFGIYRRILEWAKGKPVTIRMLDLGADKQLPGIGGSSRESFMGLRGTRLLLARQEMARVQARALLRSAVYGNLNVMLPMVTVPSEVEDMAEIFREEALLLVQRNIPCRISPIGIMVEVPAAALMLDTFGSADFFSFGTNDLAQYLAAAARDDPAVASLYVQATPALLRLLNRALDLAEAMGKPVSICGDIAGDPQYLPDLLSAGLRHFSVAPAQLAAVKSAVSALRADGTRAAGD